MDASPDNAVCPGGITLFANPRRRRAEAIVLAILSLLWLVGVCLAAYAERDPLILIVACIPALGITVAVINVNPRSVYLKLSPQGFEYGYLFTQKQYAWSDVTPFRVLCNWDKQGRKIERVAADLSATYRGKEHRIPRRLRFIFRADIIIPDTFDMTAEELAELMNRFREHAAENPNPGGQNN